MSSSSADLEAHHAEEMMAFILRLRSRGLTDQAVLNAVSTLPRPLFVLPEHARLAWEDHALPIQCGQSITPPGIAAFIAERLEVEATDRVLEIGTGSGYLTAVLARLSRRVLTLDRWRTLVTEAEQRLRAVAILNVTMMVADGSAGWGAQAPFDRIVATAAFSSVPKSLVAQLAPGGKLIVPVGGAGEAQRLVLVEGHDGAETTIATVRMTPIVAGVAGRL